MLYQACYMFRRNHERLSVILFLFFMYTYILTQNLYYFVLVGIKLSDPSPRGRSTMHLRERPKRVRYDTKSLRALV